VAEIAIRNNLVNMAVKALAGLTQWDLIYNNRVQWQQPSAIGKGYLMKHSVNKYIQIVRKYD